MNLLPKRKHGLQKAELLVQHLKETLGIPSNYAHVVEEKLWRYGDRTTTTHEWGVAVFYAPHECETAQGKTFEEALEVIKEKLCTSLKHTTSTPLTPKSS